MNKENLQIQLPAELVARVQNQAQKTGRDPAEIAIAALWLYFSILPDRNNIPPTTQERLAHLEHRLTKLEQIISGSGSSHTATLPADMPGYALGKDASSDYRTNAPDPQSRKDIARAIANVEGIPLADDDIEDEPDEILYDFLDPNE
jgi:hypothetical protein